MPSNHNQDSKFDQLRKKAEVLLQNGQDLDFKPPSDMLELIYELQVHQVELEVQNEELTKSQNELSSLHQKYENLYEFAPCGYITLNSKGIITQANLTAVSLLNTNRSLLLHLGLSPFIVPGWIDHFFAAKNKATEAGEKQVIELPLRLSNEKVLWVQATIEADLMQSGAVHEWRIILTDISERKRLEEQSIIASEVLDLYENAPCGYHSLDKDGFFVRINTTELSWLGYTPDEIIGKKKFVDLLTARSVETFKKNLSAFTEHGYVNNLEFEMIRKDGTIMPVLLNASTVKDESGKYLMSRSTIFDITERKRAEEALRKSEERIRHLNSVRQAYNKVNQIIFHASDHKQMLEDICQALVSTRGYYNAWIILLDNEQNITGWGQTGLEDKFPEMLVRFQDKILPQNLRNTLSSPYLQVVLDPVNKCRDCPLATSYAGCSSFSVRLEVEGYVLGLLTVSISRNLAGDSEEQELFTSLAGTIAHGVERIRLEKIRRTQSERLKNYERIISRTNDFLSLLDRDYRYLVVNEAYSRMFGKKEQEIEGLTVEELLGKEVFQNQIKHHLDEALAGEEVVFEVSFPESHGSIRYEIVSLYPFYDQEGLVSKVVVSVKNITERKLNEQKLANERRFLSTILDNIQEAIVVCDKAGHLVRFNESARRLHGISEQSIPPEQWATYYDLYQPDGITPLATREIPLYRALQGEYLKDVEIVVTPKHESQRFFICSGQPLFEAGEINGAVVMMADITERKQLEQLKEDVDKITRHDLKTPLDGIIGLPQILLSEENLNEEQKELIEHIREAGYRMLNMINMSLSLYQMEKGEYDFYSRPTDVVPIIQDIQKDLSTLCSSYQNGISVSLAGAKDVNGFVVSGDKLLCYTMLSNLIRNAVESTPQGDNVHIKLEEAEPNQAKISIHNPVMIPEQIQEQLGQKYVTAEKKKGTGLGVYSVRLIVQTMNGSLTWSTSSESGTYFIVYLPMPELDERRWTHSTS